MKSFSSFEQRRQFLRGALAVGWLALVPGELRSQSTVRSTVEVLALDGTVKSLQSRSLLELAGALRGSLLLAGSDGYDLARPLFFDDRFNRHPAFIVQATGAADVALAVSFARENGLLLAVKGGGHSDFGVSSHNQAMMLDLGLLRGVRVDSKRRRAWVAGATPTGLIDHETGAHLLAVPLGGNPTVGIGGLALGGGIGKLGRSFGLTLDSVRGIDVVCADGELRRANASENEDLFWALRGGGGNFGVATSLELKLHPIPQRVLAGTIRFPFSQLHQIAAAYGSFAGSASDQLYVELLIQVKDNAEASVLQLNVCYVGDFADADRVLRPLRQFGDVQHDDIKAVRYSTAQQAEAHSAARAPASGVPRDTLFRSAFINVLNASLAAALADSLSPDPGCTIVMLFLHAGGAISRRPVKATAFANRAATHDMIFVATWPKERKQYGERASQIWNGMHAFADGFYVNEMAGGVTPSEVAANYGVNASRLAAIKGRWDPQNLFRLNANLLPTTS